MDVTMIGLQNAGKTSLLRVLSVGTRNHHPPKISSVANHLISFAGWRIYDRVSTRPSLITLINFVTPLGVEMVVIGSANRSCSSIPTVGFNMKRVQRGHVTLKCWDLGGQPRFRPMWERYCRGVNAIVFIVDIADQDLLPMAKEELHSLMSQPSLEGIPLLVLGNKSDLHIKLSVDELIDALDLKSIGHREVSCYGISAKEETNLDAVIQWLMKWANR